MTRSWHSPTEKIPQLGDLSLSPCWYLGTYAVVWPISLHITAKVTCIHNTDPSLPSPARPGPDRKISLYSVVAGSLGAVCTQSSSTRRFSFRRFLWSQSVLIFCCHEKARVTQACDIFTVVSQPVVTFSFVTKLPPPPPPPSPASTRDCPPGPVPRLVICCTGSYHSLSYQDHDGPQLCSPLARPSLVWCLAQWSGYPALITVRVTRTSQPVATSVGGKLCDDLVMFYYYTMTYEIKE